MFLANARARKHARALLLAVVTLAAGRGASAGTGSVTFTTYTDAACTQLPKFAGASSSAVTLRTGTACNQAPKAGVSNLQCFADTITYTNHPNDNSCGSSSARANELKVGVCTEFPGPVRTWKLIEAANYACGGSSNTGNTITGTGITSSTGGTEGMCCTDGSPPVIDGDHTTPPCKDDKPPSTDACASANAGSNTNGSTGSQGQKPGGQVQGGAMQRGTGSKSKMVGGSSKTTIIALSMALAVTVLIAICLFAKLWASIGGSASRVGSKQMHLLPVYSSRASSPTGLRGVKVCPTTPPPPTQNATQP